MRGSLARWETKPHISGVDRIPAETAEVLQSFFSSKKRFAKIQPGWLSKWMAGRVFFVVIIVAKEQQDKGVILQQKLHKRHKGSLKK